MAGVKIAVGILACALLAASCNNNLFSALGDKLAVSEKEPPEPGNAGALAAGTARATVIPLSWTKAQDKVTAQGDLEYQVVRSLEDNIKTRETAMANGTVAVKWTKDIGSCEVTGLSVLTTYYVNVLVRDRAGNMAAYGGASKRTENDTTAPTPGSPASLTIDNATMDHYAVSWTKGSDDISPQSKLTYQVYYSRTTSLTGLTAAQVIAQGTPYGSPVTDTTAVDLVGLDDYLLYNVNVLIRDENNNATAYQGSSALYPKHPRIYWCERTAHLIRRAELNGPPWNDTTVYDTGASTQPTALALDPVNKVIYYAAQGAGFQTISGVGFSGTGRFDIITSGLGAPRGLALDLDHGYIYWTDATSGGVYRVLLSTRNSAAPSPITSAVSPNGIAVDPTGGYIYWVEGSLIRRASLNGTGATTINSGDYLMPFDLCLASGMIWVTDGDSSRAMVSKMNTAGTGRINVISNLATNNSPRGVAVDTTNGTGNFYWTQSSTTINALHMAPVGTTNGSPDSFKITTIDESGKTPIGIAVY